MQGNLRNIRRLREDRGMTQDDLAKAVGVSPPAVSKWERGLAFPSMSKVTRLSEVFSVSTDVILGIKSASA